MADTETGTRGGVLIASRLSPCTTHPAVRHMRCIRPTACQNFDLNHLLAPPTSPCSFRAVASTPRLNQRSLALYSPALDAGRAGQRARASAGRLAARLRSMQVGCPLAWGVHAGRFSVTGSRDRVGKGSSRWFPSPQHVCRWAVSLAPPDSDLNIFMRTLNQVRERATKCKSA